MSNEKDFKTIKDEIIADLTQGSVTKKELIEQTVTYDNLDTFVTSLLVEANEVGLDHLNKELEKLGLRFRWDGSIHLVESGEEIDDMFARGEESADLKITKGITEEIIEGVEAK
jgi:hypothetical protein